MRFIRHPDTPLCLAGDPYEAGVALGRTVRVYYDAWIEAYLSAWPARDGVLDRGRLRREGAAWVRAQPERFRREFEGLAAGAGLPLSRVGESYASETAATRCSGCVVRLDGRLWVTRNNDVWSPELWGDVHRHEISGRLPRLSFGTPVETMTTTGINHERLWIHDHALASPDTPRPDRPVLDTFAIVSIALETCTSIEDVETLLETVDRRRGMILVVVDGKTGEVAVFECSCRRLARRPWDGDMMVVTNHACALGRPSDEPPDPGSRVRFDRLGALVDELRSRGRPPVDPAGELQRVMGDDGVEQRLRDRTTVFSNVVCPATGEIWYASGNGPAASAGRWRRIEWPW